MNAKVGPNDIFKFGGERVKTKSNTVYVVILGRAAISLCLSCVSLQNLNSSTILYSLLKFSLLYLRHAMLLNRAKLMG